MPPKKTDNFFTKTLLDWNKQVNKRQMPWKGEKDPYKVWLSEVILQQTRVEQGLAYYNRFIESFSTVNALASASDEEVFKLWEGLGYYSRCRNLLATARYISFELGGVFPNTYPELLALKGVGPYTAAAIGSFAFNLPYAVVDGNVFRVLARYMGITTPIDTTEGKKEFTTIAQNFLDQKSPGLYNQALMDFGATVCKPAAPDCGRCVLQKNCRAFAKKWVDTLPVKRKKLIKTKRWFYYFILRYSDQVYVEQRTEKDIWQGLHQFYLVETKDPVTWTSPKIKNWLKKALGVQKATIQSISGSHKQVLTHQEINGGFIEIALGENPKTIPQKNWVGISELKLLAFPRFINRYFEERDTKNN